MALLNYAQSLVDLQDKGGLNYSQLSNWSQNDKLKLILTGDKHIITHGVDLLSDYSNGTRGLVPNYDFSALNSEYGILTKDGWKVLTNDYIPTLTLDKIPTLSEEKIPSLSISKLPVAESISDNDSNHVLTSAQIQKYVNDKIVAGFAANDAMVFKGGVATEEKLPTEYSAGYTYRATDTFKLNDEDVQPGDLVIAKGDSDSENAGWFVVQTNINGKVKVTINGVEYEIYSDTSLDNPSTIYAPSTVGTSGDILVSNGTNLEWAKVSGSAENGAISFTAKNGENILSTFSATASGDWGINITGNAATATSAATAKNLVDAPTITTAGDDSKQIAVTVGGQTSTAFTVPFATNATNAVNANSAVTATTADKVKSSLKLGEGLIFTEENADSYNGSAERTVQLKPATATSLGGIKVGSHLNINEGVLSVNAQELVGEVIADVKNINYTIDAENNSQNNASKLNLKLTNAAGTSTSTKASVAISGADGILVKSDDTTSISLSLATASSDVQGGIKLGYTEDKSGQNYPVQLSDGKAFVHVPWTDSNNTWRAVQVDNDSVFDTSVNTNNILKFISSDSIAASVNEGKIAFTAKLNSDAGLELISEKGIGLKATGVTANTYGPSADVTQTSGGSSSINVPIITVDEYGRITNAGTHSLTVVDTTYTNGAGLSLSNNQFSLNKATTNTLGGIKTGYTPTEGLKNYAVKVDDTGNAYVEVPWTDTNINTNREIKVGQNTLLQSSDLNALTFVGTGKTSVSGENGTISISSTWRKILIGENSIGDQDLKFVPTGDIYVKGDTTNDNAYELSFGLSWYNISKEGTDKYEYVQ